MSKQSQPMTPAAASRIQSSGALKTGGATPKGSFAARAQSAAARPQPRSPGTARKG